MQKFTTPLSTSRLTMLIVGVMLALGVVWPLMGAAQDKSDKAKDPDPHAQHKEKQAAGGQDLDGQKQGMKMEGMNTQKQDSAWWFDNYSRGPKPDMGGKILPGGEGGMTGMMKGKRDAASMMVDSASSGMGMIGDVGPMGMIADDMGLMGAVAIGGAGSKSVEGMGEMKMASSLPGSPGVSRLYHVGAAGFFLNHAEHITLTTKQQAALNVIQQKALLSKFTAQRKIDQAEQELWELTGADELDVTEIQAKVQTIEKLRGEQRLAFIQTVAEAAKLLTDEQRQMLLGTTGPDTSAGK